MLVEIEQFVRGYLDHFEEVRKRQESLLVARSQDDFIRRDEKLESVTAKDRGTGKDKKSEFKQQMRADDLCFSIELVFLLSVHC